MKMAGHTPTAGISMQDLEVEELNITSAVLTAGASHFANHCKAESDTFMLCRTGDKDPRKCLEEGKNVTKCGQNFFKLVKESCNEPFTAYWTCLEYNNQEYRYCRKTQQVFDDCMASINKK